MPEDFHYIPGGVLSRQDPPPISTDRSERTDTNWKLISTQLRSNPHVWFLVAIGSHALAQYPRIKTGRTENWQPKGHFEAATRNIDGAIRLWIRYLGDGNPVTNPGMVTMQDIAFMAGVSRQRANDVVRFEGFPEPLPDSPTAVRVWDRAAVEQFIESWDRRPGRRPRTSG